MQLQGDSPGPAMVPHHAARRDHPARSASRLADGWLLAPDDDAYAVRLNAILRDLHDAAHLLDVVPGSVEDSLLALLGVSRLTLYLRSRKHSSLVGRYRVAERTGERHVYFGPGSIVGYVAVTREPVLAADAHCPDSLRDIHPHLRFDPGLDRETVSRTRAVCAVPLVSKGVLLGVLEAANPWHGGEFHPFELRRLQEIASFLGQKLRYDFRATCSPFEFLVKTDRIESDVLRHLDREHLGRAACIARCLVRDVGLSSEMVGISMERYYQVPFLRYLPSLTPVPQGIERLGLEELRARGMVALSGESGRTIVAAEDPNDTAGILDIQQALHLQEYDVCVALREDVLRYLEPASLNHDRCRPPS